MDKNELIYHLSNKSELDIYYEYLLGQKVWYFQKNSDNYSSDYDLFKKFIARNLKIPFNNISIVGSAKTRFSFSPNKNLREFNEDSDFDLIIVSHKLFNNLWSAFREVASSYFLHNYQYKSENVFNGFISVRDNDPTYGNPTLVSWQQSILAFKAELQLTFNIRHEINYRIYSDWESVEYYHLKGISKLKSVINEIN